MTIPAILVDTDLLWKRSIRDRLTEKIEAGHLHVFVPTLMHAERIRQIADEKGDKFAIDVIRQIVNASKFRLLPFETQDAEAIADIWLKLKKGGSTSKDWKRHSRDILLCAVAHSRGYTLISDDKGSHFDVVADKKNTSELIVWLDTIG